MIPLTNEDLMRGLRDATGSNFDPNIRRAISDIERTGTHVTIFEVIGTEAILIIAHESMRPTVASIRKAYDEYLAARKDAP